MEYRPLGRTGLYVSTICLGTMTWGGRGRWEAIGQVGQEAVNEQLKCAVEAGVNFIDTANVYHEGWSEELLGQAIRDTGIPREDLVIATKVRGRMRSGINGMGLTRVHIHHEVDASLRRLGLDHIDLYQIHGLDPLTPIDETLWSLDDLVRSGKVAILEFPIRQPGALPKPMRLPKPIAGAGLSRCKPTTLWRDGTWTVKFYPCAAKNHSE